MTTDKLEYLKDSARHDGATAKALGNDYAWSACPTYDMQDAMLTDIDEYWAIAQAYYEGFEGIAPRT